MLRKRSQIQKVIYYMITFIWHSGKGTTIATDQWMLGAKDGTEVDFKERNRELFRVMECGSQYMTVLCVFKIKAWKTMLKKTNFNVCKLYNKKTTKSKYWNLITDISNPNLIFYLLVIQCLPLRHTIKFWATLAFNLLQYYFLVL